MLKSSLCPVDVCVCYVDEHVYVERVKQCVVVVMFVCCLCNDMENENY